MTHSKSNNVKNNWIDINNAAEYSGVSKSTIRRAIQKGQLKCSKTTGKLLFEIIAIDRWLRG